MTGLIGTIFLTDEQKRILSPEIAAVRDLADQTRAMMEQIHNEAIEVAAQFKPIVRNYFDDPKFPVPTVVESKEGLAQKNP